MEIMGRRWETSLCGPRGFLGGLGRRGRDARSGTETVYLTALQKQPPVRVKGVVGSVAIGVVLSLLDFKLTSTEAMKSGLVTVKMKLSWDVWS